MEQKADYAELRRLYFSHPEKDKTPSHSIESNFESELDEPLETPSSRLHEVMTSTLDANEMFSSIGQDEVNEFTTQLSNVQMTLFMRYTINMEPVPIQKLPK